VIDGKNVSTIAGGSVTHWMPWIICVLPWTI